MPAVAFAANFLWVMVIGLIGPAIPAIIRDLEISYTQAGLFFTTLAFGSLIGTSLGGIASDYTNKKRLLFFCCCFLVSGLIAVGFSATYLGLLLIIFYFSLLGSPIGAIGQSVMLAMYPGKREKYLSFQTVFAAAGSLLAPILVSLNFSAGLNWRWSFMEAGFLGIILGAAILMVKMPVSAGSGRKMSFLPVLRNRRVLFCGAIIFLAIAVDLGFAYWLAEYFTSDLSVSIRFASAVVGIYLAGIITGRSSIPLLLRRFKGGRIILLGLALGLVSLLFFIYIPVTAVKVVLCYLYGLGIAPLFPLMMAKGAEVYPDQPGSVTGILFAFMSGGGIVFPLFLGFLAERVGIANSYLFSALVIVIIIVALTVYIRKKNY